MKKHLIISSLVALSTVIASNAKADLTADDVNNLIETALTNGGNPYQTQNQVNSSITTALDNGGDAYQTASDVAQALANNGNAYQTRSQVNSSITTALANSGDAYQTESQVNNLISGSALAGRVTSLEEAGYQNADDVNASIATALANGTDAYQTESQVNALISENAYDDSALNTAIDRLNSDVSVDGSVLYSIANNAATASYNNATSGLSATTLQDAINEVAVIANAPARELYTVDLNTNPGSGNLSGTSFINDLYALDNAIGNKSQLSNTRHANAPTVTDAIVSLDTQVALNEDNIEINRQNIAQNRADIDANTQRISSLSDAVSALDTNLNHIDQRIDKVENNLKSGLAAVTALTALVPNARDCGDTQLSVGAGMYSNRAGVAFGGFHYLNDHILLNAGASFGGAKDLAFRAGITFGL